MISRENNTISKHFQCIFLVEVCVDSFRVFVSGLLRDMLGAKTLWEQYWTLVDLTFFIDQDFLLHWINFIIIKEITHSVHPFQITFTSLRITRFISFIKLSKPLIDIEKIIDSGTRSSISYNESIVNVWQICTNCYFVLFVIRVYMSDVFTNRK